MGLGRWAAVIWEEVSHSYSDAQKDGVIARLKRERDELKLWVEEHQAQAQQHKHRMTKRAGGRHATHAGHSKTCANTYPGPVPVHRCRCRCSPGACITTPARAPAHELLAPRTVVAAPATRTICGAKTATVDAIAQSPRYSGRRCGRRCPGTAITTPVLPQLLSSPAGCCHDR
jgi:hypothetical protein